MEFPLHPPVVRHDDSLPPLLPSVSLPKVTVRPSIASSSPYFRGELPSRPALRIDTPPFEPIDSVLSSLAVLTALFFHS